MSDYVSVLNKASDYTEVDDFIHASRMWSLILMILILI